jgi:hypothetical protein
MSNSEENTLRVVQAVPLKGNRKYRLSFFVKTENIESNGTRHSGACVNIFAGRNFWFPSIKYTGTISWTKQVFEFTTPPKTVSEKTRLNLYLLKAKGTVWFDDLKLIPVEPAQK